MKKMLFFLVFVFSFLVILSAQNARDSVFQKIIDQKIIEKVEKHDKLVERLEWTRPAILAPTIGGILAICYAIWLHFWGLEKKAREILSSPPFNSSLEEKVNQKVIAAAKAKEEKIKSKPICIIYLPGKDMKKLDKLLKSLGYSNIKSHSIDENFEIEANTVLIFNDEDGDFTDKIGDYIRSNEKIRSRGHFFYYGSKRFMDSEIKMKNFANSEDTLAARLFESISVA